MDKTNNETKICSDPDCKSVGKPQPIERFRRARYGRIGICSACMSLRHKKGIADARKRKAGAQAQVKKPVYPYVPEPPEAPPASSQKPASSNGHTITIDFAGHDDLLDGLRRKAEDALRTPENMLLFMIKQSVEDFNALDRGA